MEGKWWACVFQSKIKNGDQDTTEEEIVEEKLGKQPKMDDNAGSDNTPGFRYTAPLPGGLTTKIGLVRCTKIFRKKKLK